MKKYLLFSKGAGGSMSWAGFEAKEIFYGPSGPPPN